MTLFIYNLSIYLFNFPMINLPNEESESSNAISSVEKSFNEKDYKWSRSWFSAMMIFLMLMVVGLAVTLIVQLFFRHSYTLSLFTEEAKFKPGVSAVFSSRNRHDLLNQTLSSFFEYNTYPLDKVVIVEDGFFREDMVEMMKKYSNCTWILTGESADGSHPGQLKALDLAYSLVETEWIFHSEDDWKFRRGGFIE